MYELVLQHRYRNQRYRLVLRFPRRGYYLRTHFETGKTIYQILFEHLVEKKIVSAGALARKYKKVNPVISPGIFMQAIKRIETSLKTAQDPRLKAMKFVRPKIGHGSPPINRRSPNANYTARQREIIDEATKMMYQKFKHPTRAMIRIGCMQMLKKEGLAENVAISNRTIIKCRKRLGLPTSPASMARRGKANNLIRRI